MKNYNIKLTHVQNSYSTQITKKGMQNKYYFGLELDCACNIQYFYIYKNFFMFVNEK